MEFSKTGGLLADLFGDAGLYANVTGENSTLTTFASDFTAASVANSNESEKV